MNERDEIIQCPCYNVCAGLGLEMKQWCRYRKSQLPPPGMHRFHPKETWCPPGAQANILLLAYLVADRAGDAKQLEPAIEQVKRWANDIQPRSER